MASGYSLGDLLSSSQKNSIVQNHIQVGSVFLTNLTESDGIYLNPGEKEKPKFLIIVGFDNHGCAVGVVLINSKINLNVEENKGENQYNQQYPLKAAKYPALLKWDSYVNCNHIFPINQARIIDSCKHIADIDPEDLLFILESCIESPIIEPKKKKRFNLIAELEKLSDQINDYSDIS